MGAIMAETFNLQQSRLNGPHDKFLSLKPLSFQSRPNLMIHL